MDLPSIQTTPDSDGFIPVAAADQFSTDEITAVSINGTAVVFVQWQGSLHAFYGRCPHASARLAEGDFFNGKLICPDHAYCFSVTNGRILWPADEVYRLKRYPLKEDNGIVKIQIQ